VNIVPDPYVPSPKYLSLQIFRGFSAALAAKTTIRKSMKAGYGPYLNSTKRCKKRRKTNLILVESNHLVPSKSRRLIIGYIDICTDHR
jgi:hypothetical protein